MIFLPGSFSSYLSTEARTFSSWSYSGHLQPQGNQPAHRTRSEHVDGQNQALQDTIAPLYYGQVMGASLPLSSVCPFELEWAL